MINTFFVLNVVYLNVVCILGVMSVCNGLRRACLSILNYVSHFFLKVSEVYLLHDRDTDEINPAQLDCSEAD